MNKKLKMYKTLGATLIEKGIWFLKKAFSVKYTKIITGTELKNFLQTVGVERNKVYTADKRYWICDWSVIKEIIKYDWIDRRKYISDQFDCDDYAESFKSHLAEIYGINSIAFAKGVKVRIINKNKYAWHRCILIVASENYKLKAFIFEAQNDRFQELKKGTTIKIGNWEYELGSFWF